MEEFQDQRCYSNGIFVRALKEHSDALNAIQLLRNDVLPVAVNQDGAELVQIQDATKKLAAYKHLFNEQALAEFEQLAESVDPSTGEWDEAATDNHREGLKLIKAANDASGRNIGGGGLDEQILALLDKLEAHLEQSITDLQVNEVKAAWDLAVWLQDSEAEIAHLDHEEVRRNVYLDKTLISVQAARAQENKAWEIYFQSASNYNNAVKMCIKKGEEYMEDRHKRQDENGLLDEIIKIFKEQVATLGSDVRSGNIVRKQDTSDRGSVAKNTAAQAAGF